MTKDTSDLVQGRIAALVSVYNAEQFLDNRLDNLLNQTVEGMVIYVYDACSPQNEAGIVKKYQSDPRAARTPIYYHRSETRTHLYESWNWIITRVATQFLATANADDLIHPDYYKVAIESMESGGHDLVYCPWLSTTTENQKLDSWPPPHNHLHDPPPGSTCGHFPVWRRDLHLRYGLFDPRFRAIGDAEFWRRIVKYGARLHKLPEPYGLYLDRGETNLYFSAKDPAGGEAYRSEEGLIAATPVPNPHAPALER